MGKALAEDDAVTQEAIRLVGEYGVASARHLHELVFRHAKSSVRGRGHRVGSGPGLRATQVRLQRMRRNGELADLVLRIQQRPYRLLSLSGQRRDPAALTTAWQRIDVASELSAANYTVGHDAASALSLRRYLIDCAPSPSVKAALRADARVPGNHGLSFDVAVRERSAGDEVVLVWVDDGRDIDLQVQALALWVPDQPRVKVIVRPNDDGSVWDPAGEKYSTRGPRLEGMLRALAESAAIPVRFGNGGHRAIEPTTKQAPRRGFPEG